MEDDVRAMHAMGPGELRPELSPVHDETAGWPRARRQIHVCSLGWEELNPEALCEWQRCGRMCRLGCGDGLGAYPNMREGGAARGGGDLRGAEHVTGDVHLRAGGWVCFVLPCVRSGGGAVRCVTVLSCESVFDRRDVTALRL